MADETRGSITEKADAAFRQAAAKVIEHARRTSTPIVVWEDGRPVERTWKEMEQKLAKEPER